MTEHYHYGHGLAGHGPDEPQVCRGIVDLGDCVATELTYIVEAWGDQAHAERRDMEALKKLRPSNGADPVGYPGSWESIATAAMRALECLDMAEEADTLRQNLSPTRQNAPLYRGSFQAWEAELRRMLLGSGTYPLTTTIDGNHRFYVWVCTDWEHLVSEHDHDSIPGLKSRTGSAYMPCACRDCMDVIIWSPDDETAPYCDACEAADCATREYPECLVDRDA